VKNQAPFNFDCQEKLVIDIFAKIAPRYDFLNHFLSFGQDIVWRNSTVRKMHFFKTYRCLDVATGTGDMAIEVAKKHPGVRINGIDLSEEMISLAKKKTYRKNLADAITFETADATRLPFNDESFDVSVIAFGIRNIPDKMTALKEMARVTVQGGQIIVLEMVSQQKRWFQYLYQGYLCVFLPRIARLFCSHRIAYRYLGQSILNFPTLEEFVSMMHQSGINLKSSSSMTFGIVQLFIGEKS